MRLVSLGADPEVFVEDKDTGKVVSAIGLVPGTKEDPYKTPNGFIHYDNVMAEMNVNPAKNITGFKYNVLAVQNDLQDILSSQGNYGLKIKASHRFDTDDLLHADARKFYCVPDFDAWGEEESMALSADTVGNLRSAGGHIHIGISNEHFDLREHLVRYLDLYLGVPLSMMDKDTSRREIYGRAGRYRNKIYGIEYRVPSNIWIKNGKNIGMVFDIIQNVITNLFPFDRISEPTKNLIQSAINQRDISAAIKLTKIYPVLYPSGLDIPNYPNDVMRELACH